jgi:uroporphyrinogen-III synthase
VVLNTRPSEQASELSERLRAAGFEAVEAPAIAIVPAWDNATLAQIRVDLRAGAFAWIVLASANAGRGVEHDLQRPGLHVLCGAATAAALGLRPAVALDRFSAVAAVDALRPVVGQGQRILVPRAAEGREELVDGLRALGAEVVAPVVYRTVPSAAAATRLRQRDVDVVTLCSPSAASSVAASVSAATLVVCLGGTTASAARAYGLRVDRVADQPSMAALVLAIETALAARV